VLKPYGVVEGPLTGYELTKAFDRSVTFIWHAVQGQIYPELSCLAAAGLIRQNERRPARREALRGNREGIAELRRWITAVAPARGVPNETLMRVFLAHLVDPTDVEAFLRREADEYRRWLARLERFAAEFPPTTRSERASGLTVDAGIRVLEASIEWAEAAMDEVSTW
jgi:DNA-binding PadR family transcriptional regulator